MQPVCIIITLKFSSMPLTPEIQSSGTSLLEDGIESVVLEVCDQILPKQLFKVLFDTVSSSKATLVLIRDARVVTDLELLKYGMLALGTSNSDSVSIPIEIDVTENTSTLDQSRNGIQSPSKLNEIDLLDKKSEFIGRLSYFLYKRRTIVELLSKLQDIESEQWNETAQHFPKIFKESSTSTFRTSGKAPICYSIPREQLIDSAISLINNQCCELALALLNAAKKAAVNNGLLEYFRAVAYAKLKRYVEANMCVQQALLLSPKNSQVTQLIALLEEAKTHTNFDNFDYRHVAQSIDMVPGFLVDGQEEFLFKKVKALPQNATIVEIGSYQGRSATAMGFACIGSNRKIYCIDTFCGNDGVMGRSKSCYENFTSNISLNNLSKYINPLQGFSTDKLKEWDPSRKIDFAFIDGSHEYDQVMLDFQLIYPLVNDGGWIALHDVGLGWPGSWRVWREVGTHLLECHEYSSSLACGRKVAGRSFPKIEPNRFNLPLEVALHIREMQPELAELSSAMEETMLAPSDQALTLISQMSLDFHKELLCMEEMLKKENMSDPYITLWVALGYCGQGKNEEARHCLSQNSELYQKLPAAMLQFISKLMTNSVSLGQAATISS